MPQQVERCPRPSLPPLSALWDRQHSLALQPSATVCNRLQSSLQSLALEVIRIIFTGFAVSLPVVQVVPERGRAAPEQ